jgi:hypothetical protein
VELGNLKVEFKVKVELELRLGIGVKLGLGLGLGLGHERCSVRKMSEGSDINEINNN